MTHEQAHQILDRLKDGFAFPRSTIDYALFLTGDLDMAETMRGTGMAQSLSSQSTGRWGRESKSMVAHGHHGYRANQGLGSGHRATASDEHGA